MPSLIRRLPEGVVNRIAAGEVVERPASVVKELAENAIDAGAGRVEIEIDEGGRGLIAVSDDGCGMHPSALRLAVERHATSKLPGDDLVRITYLGFRGEALAAIGSISRLRIISRTRDGGGAFAIEVAGGEVGDIEPCAGVEGTRVEVRDLFWRTPARLKFLRGVRAEIDTCFEVTRRLALARPEVAFSLRVDGRGALELPAAKDLLAAERHARAGAIMGRAFLESAIEIEAVRERMRLTGLVALPTLARADSRLQYLVVNGRPVQDRALKGALRAAYTDLLFHDRQPLAILHLSLPADDVDVNVHPAKAEVRFGDAATVRGLLIGAVRRALAEHGHRASPSRSAGLLRGVRSGDPGWRSVAGSGLAEAALMFQGSPPNHVEGAAAPVEPVGGGAVEDAAGMASFPEAGRAFDLGAAVAQVHDTYILSETIDGLVIVDQHAAHERMVYERLKASLRNGGVPRQILLIPEVVELVAGEASILVERAGELAAFGMVVEAFGEGAVLVRELPALLGHGSAASLVRDLAADLTALGSTLRLELAMDRVLGVIACHGSVRAGRRLGREEMNALLRSLEQGRHTGQCIHGRPTYIEFKKSDIEQLFDRR